MHAFRILAAALMAIVLPACTTLFPRGGEDELAAGVRIYEEGEYAKAAQSLQKSLDLGLHESDQVRAHKYLAFIHCVSGRVVPCRNEFRLALAINPSFELEPAEAGHPKWGPAFRTAKAGR